MAGEVGGVIGRAEGGTAGKVQCVCVQMVHIAWFTGLLKIREKVLPGVQCLRMYLISTKAHAKLLWLASNVILNSTSIACFIFCHGMSAVIDEYMCKFLHGMINQIS